MLDVLIMKIGIITPMAEEKGSLVAALENITVRQYGGSEIIEGTYKNHDVVLTESGIGKVAAGAATAMLLNNYAPDLLVNTGSAGALDENLVIGDEVIGTHLAYHDVDVTAFGYEYGQLPAQPLYFESDAQVVTEFTALTTTRTGLIVSGDQFIQQSQKDKIKAAFPTALLAEMESAAVAQVATRFGTPFIVLRSVSDLADGHSDVTFDEFVVEAGRRSAALLLRYLDSKTA
ncbi:hypothetical protein C5L23_001312 [Leuconostoc fallax]|uniref:adenosylhomocysteine nucleosidase n=2 Tax=Leuconostoc fallax TaxID=1251 RepID=A0A4R5N745_9LACO|nr:hypothetical protein C5L23_001312 [Leuconostoc fallax]